MPSEQIIKAKRISQFDNVDTSQLKSHPSIQIYELQKQHAMLNTKVQRAALLPEFLLLYNNTTMKGFGSDNQLYDGSNRFQSAQLGVGIPFFNKSQRAKIKSAQLNERMANENYLLIMKEQAKQFASLIDSYLQLNNTLQYYENSALKNAELISSSANKKFAQGEINYLEWDLLLNQSLNIQLEYFDALRQYNQVILQLNYFNTSSNNK
jgi:cobalt-zinc-cadmium resistance protein CzcA